MGALISYFSGCCSDQSIQRDDPPPNTPEELRIRGHNAWEAYKADNTQISELVACIAPLRKLASRTEVGAAGRINTVLYLALSISSKSKLPEGTRDDLEDAERYLSEVVAATDTSGKKPTCQDQISNLRTNMGEAYLVHYKRQSYDPSSKYLKEALGHFRQAVQHAKLPEDRLWARINLANALLYKSDVVFLEEALEIMNQARRLSPRSPAFTEPLDRAIECVREGITGAPEGRGKVLEEARRLLGTILSPRGSGKRISQSTASDSGKGEDGGEDIS